MPKTKPPYPAAFKQQIVELAMAGRSPAELAREFDISAQSVTAWVARAAQAQGIATIACGGGCFLNAILARELRAELSGRGLVMLEAMAVPPNDGGLSLGQAWVALQATMTGD